MHHRSSLCFLLCGLLAITAPVAGPAQTLLDGEREAQVTAIPGVVAAGAQWTLVWADFYTADGILGTPDGGVLFAQEQTDKILKLNLDGSVHTVFENMNAPGSVAIDTAGRMFTVQRTCTEPLNAELPGCNELTRVMQIAPDVRLLANSFDDGRPLGRLNDLIADGQGGAYFTSGGIYHVSWDRKVSVVAGENIQTNGLMLSPNGRTLYVTNRDRVVAFDVADDGSTSNRRDFVVFPEETFTDGITLDAEGRLYVTAGQGIHVVAANGEILGTIPTPRAAITAAFAGPDKKTLYVPMMGAIGPNGKAWTTPEGIRNTAMTIYTLPMESTGFAGRPK
jgi:gluconolactonase